MLLAMASPFTSRRKTSSSWKAKNLDMKEKHKISEIINNLYVS